MPAVSVVVRGATAGTSTQADGTYTLNVPLGSNEIIVSMVGYVSQTLSIGSEIMVGSYRDPDLPGKRIPDDG